MLLLKSARSAWRVTLLGPNVPAYLLMNAGQESHATDACEAAAAAREVEQQEITTVENKAN